MGRIHEPIPFKGRHTNRNCVRGMHGAAREFHGREVVVNELTCSGYIYKNEDGEYEAWLVPEGEGKNIINGFIAGMFDNFDAATHALISVQGMTITPILADV
jgi:hypothetical protein